MKEHRHHRLQETCGVNAGFHVLTLTYRIKTASRCYRKIIDDGMTRRMPLIRRRPRPALQFFPALKNECAFHPFVVARRSANSLVSFSLWRGREFIFSQDLCNKQASVIAVWWSTQLTLEWCKYFYCPAEVSHFRFRCLVSRKLRSAHHYEICFTKRIRWLISLNLRLILPNALFKYNERALGPLPPDHKDRHAVCVIWLHDHVITVNIALVRLSNDTSAMPQHLRKRLRTAGILADFGALFNFWLNWCLGRCYGAHCDSQLRHNNVFFLPMEGSWIRGAAVALRLCTRLPSSLRAHTITCWLAETSAAVPLLSPLLSLTTASVSPDTRHGKNKNGRFWVSSIQHRRSGIHVSIQIYNQVLQWIKTSFSFLSSQFTLFRRSPFRPSVYNASCMHHNMLWTCS